MGPVIRRLVLLVVAVLLLVAPSGAAAAAAAKIVTESDPQVGHLGIDIQNVSTGQYHWDSLNYQLHTCGHGKADPGQCRWQLYGRTGVNYERCPAHERVETDGQTTFTNFHRSVPVGNPTLHLGPGNIALYPGWGSAKRQAICWYVQIGESPNLQLTAQTLITH
jgi:hypothetical protein